MNQIALEHYLECRELAAGANPRLLSWEDLVAKGSLGQQNTTTLHDEPDAMYYKYCLMLKTSYSCAIVIECGVQQDHSETFR
jgi:hypothetical protein